MKLNANRLKSLYVNNNGKLKLCLEFMTSRKIDEGHKTVDLLIPQWDDYLDFDFTIEQLKKM